MSRFGDAKKTSTMSVVLAISTIAMLSVLCSEVRAELYRYVDDHGDLHVTTDPGSVPARFRGRATAIQDEEPRPLPSSAGTAEPPNAVQIRAWPHDDPPTQQQTPSKEAPVLTPPPLASSHFVPSQQIVTVNTNTGKPSSPAIDFVIGLLQHELNKKFKDVKDPSQVPALNGDTAVDCTSYKKTLDADVMKLDAFMKETDAKNKRGELGMIGKVWAATQGMSMLAGFIYDIAFTPKHCSEEYERENKERLEAIGQ